MQKELIRAVWFAADKHRDQRRLDKAASPYINHPLTLAHILSEEAGVTDRLALLGAILHDTVEDTATTVEELTQLFGADVAAVVAEISDDQTLPWKKRKALQIEHAASLSYAAKLVKLADKTANLRDIAASPPTSWPISRQQWYFDWAKEVIDQLRGTHAALEALFDEAYANRPTE